MLPEVHDMLRRLMHERGGIDPAEVEVRFDAPTRELADRLIRPALSFFLIEALENTDLRQGGSLPARSTANGTASRRLPPRRIDLRYVVSAITTDAEDEHRLLWRALATLLRWQQLPSDLLPEGVRPPETPIIARVAQPDDAAGTAEIWSGLGVPPRMAFPYILTVPLDLEITFSAPLVLTRTTRFLRPAGGAPDTFQTIGGYVRDSVGQPVGGITLVVEGSATTSVSGPDGTWRLPNVMDGATRLQVSLPDGQTRLVKIEVPSASYDITLDE